MECLTLAAGSSPDREVFVKVSIITPCLNSVGTIRQTMESVLNQTYKDIEYIVVDGGSDDGTQELIKEYQPKFRGRMRYVSEKDKGIYDAMNKGIRMSHGRLIGIINSDDYYEPDAVENAVTHMTADRYQVVYGYCRVLNNRQAVDVLKNSHQDLADQMIPHPACFVTRNVYCDFGMFLKTFRIANDYELMCRLYKSGEVKFIQIRKILANFRMGGTCSNVERMERENAIIAYYHRMISFKDMLGRMLL